MRRVGFEPRVPEHRDRDLRRSGRQGKTQHPGGILAERKALANLREIAGAYLIETLLCINERLRENGAGADLGRQLVDALCRRVIGFEILTAPFVVAHLQLLLALGPLGVEPPADKRLAVFLTNALTGWDGSEQLKLNFPDLESEHEAARKVKREARIIVVLGNPPYNRFAGAPVAEESESDLVDHYKGIVRDKKGRQLGQSRLFSEWKIRKHLLDDLYIRFFRLAEKRIGEAAEHGVVSLISNSSYLTGRSHPLMRESLLGHFDDVWIDNLHGNRLASERTPSGESCEAIFNMEAGGPGIKVGTCISTFVKRRERPKKRGTARIHVRDFWGQAARNKEHRSEARQWAVVPSDPRRTQSRRLRPSERPGSSGNIGNRGPRGRPRGPRRGLWSVGTLKPARAAFGRIDPA